MIRKYAIWILLATAAGLIGAWLSVSGQPVNYTATAAVDVEPRIISGSVPVTPNLTTEERVVTSGVVLGAAASRLGVSPGHLSANVSVSVSGTSNILSISCTMPKPELAQRCASIVTDAYTNFRNSRGATKSVQAHDPLVVTVVSPAVMPLSPAGTNKSVVLSIGVLLGLLFGIGSAYVRDRADDRVRDRADLGRNLGAATVVEIPRVRERAAPAAFTFRRAPGSAAAEAYRYLRVRIDAISDGRSPVQVVQVTGPRAGEGIMAVSNNLAAALAQVGHRVILVDGNVRQARLSSLYGVSDRCGLTELLTGDVSLNEVVAHTESPRLLLIPAGLRRNDPADLFEPAALASVFRSLAAAADVVVVDSGPALAVADPIALTSVSTAVVVVADAGVTTRTDIRTAAREMSSAGSRHVVGVLNHRPRRLPGIFSSPGAARGPHPSNPAGFPLAPQRRPDDEAVGVSRIATGADDQ
jgi:polysaccharide biosynthesis transport protein